MELAELFDELHEKEQFFRLENDEDGFVLSIISRKCYPRIWVDNITDSRATILYESVEHIEARTAPLTEADWRQRFYGKTIQEVVSQALFWLADAAK